MRLSVICVALLLLVACWAQPFLGEGDLGRIKYRQSAVPFYSKLLDSMRSKSFRKKLHDYVDSGVDTALKIIKSVNRRSGYDHETTDENVYDNEDLYDLYDNEDLYD
ncbi:uncharacterized protein [Periplaneta americana]|uniref:uncharacterized protein isoform X2 n=1 Tax=Periplaneta americana TaxID=6978 RepID=UPI0037E80251